jgi:predicted secreted protein
MPLRLPPIAAAIALTTVLALLPGAPARAADGGGDADKPPLLGISADASREVANDEMNVLLRVERQSDELATANRDALARIDALLARARGVAGVESSLAGVGSNPIYAESKADGGPRERRITGWHVHADATLKSRDIEALSKLVGEFGDQARILSIGFAVSQQTRRQVESELLVEAAKAFDERARILAQSLGFSGFDIQHVSVAAGGMPRPYRAVAQEALASMKAAPDFSGAAGESTVTATANGQVWLRR